MGFACDGDLPLLHDFEQGALHFGGGAVDFVGQQQVGKHRPQHGAELAAFGVEDAGAHQVGGQQIRGELDALEAATHGFCQRVHGEGFGQPRHALNQQMALREDGHQNAFEESVLPHHHAFDFIEHAFHQCRVDSSALGRLALVPCQFRGVHAQSLSRLLGSSKIKTATCPCRRPRFRWWRQTQCQ